MRRFLMVMVGLLAVALAGLVSAPAAQAARTGAFSLRVHGTNLCAEASGTGNGSAVVLDTCNFTNGDGWTQWWYVVNGNRFQNAAAEDIYQYAGYLDYDNSAGAGDGRKVQVWAYQYPAPNQFWYGQMSAGTGRILSSWDNRCLDADASTPLRQGTKVHMWRCNGQSNQVWDVVP